MLTSKRAQGPPGVDAQAEQAADVAADAQARHEGADDHRDRVNADAAVEGQDPLPRHLVDEAGRAAHEESEPGQDQLRTHAASRTRRCHGHRRLRDDRAQEIGRAHV